MKRTLALLTLLASACTSQAQINLPATLDARVGVDTLFQGGTAKKFKWKVYAEQPSEMKRLDIAGAPDFLLFSFKASKPGKYVLLAVTVDKDGEPVMTECVITAVEGPIPPAPPIDSKIEARITALEKAFSDVSTVLIKMDQRLTALERPPPVPPTPPVPVPTDTVLPLDGKFRVLIIEETSQRKNLTSGQRAAIFGVPVRVWLNTHCVPGPDGKTPEFRIYDKDVPIASESVLWRKAVEKVRGLTPLPIIVINNGREEVIRALPEDDVLPLLKKYGGE